MKKVLALFVALALFAGSAFAEIKFGTFMRGNIILGDTGADIKTKGDSQVGAAISIFEVDLIGQNDAGTAGFFVDLFAVGYPFFDGPAVPQFGDDWAYLWVKPADFVKLTVGKYGIINGVHGLSGYFFDNTRTSSRGGVGRYWEVDSFFRRYRSSSGLGALAQFTFGSLELDLNLAGLSEKFLGEAGAMYKDVQVGFRYTLKEGTYVRAQAIGFDFDANIIQAGFVSPKFLASLHLRDKFKVIEVPFKLAPGANFSLMGHVGYNGVTAKSKYIIAELGTEFFIPFSDSTKLGFDIIVDDIKISTDADKQDKDAKKLHNTGLDGFLPTIGAGVFLQHMLDGYVQIQAGVSFDSAFALGRLSYHKDNKYSVTDNIRIRVPIMVQFGF
jgi:hypothetical protein